MIFFTCLYDSQSPKVIMTLEQNRFKPPKLNILYCTVVDGHLNAQCWETENTMSQID